MMQVDFFEWMILTEEVELCGQKCGGVRTLALITPQIYDYLLRKKNFMQHCRTLILLRYGLDGRYVSCWPTSEMAAASWPYMVWNDGWGHGTRVP
jgi:hypothetical protein